MKTEERVGFAIGWVLMAGAQAVGNGFAWTTGIVFALWLYGVV